MDWTANIVALSVTLLGTGVLALGLLWRVTTWQTSSADLLTNFEGLRIGSRAMPLSSHLGEQDAEVTFGEKTTFLVFAASGCEPCAALLQVATAHPATSWMRKVVVSDDEHAQLSPELACQWESYRFDDEKKARTDWKAPVSPYFYVIDEFSRITAKGVANLPEHLDRLLDLPPTSLQINTLEPITAGDRL